MQDAFEVSLLNEGLVTLVPGQSRSVALSVHLLDPSATQLEIEILSQAEYDISEDLRSDHNLNLDGLPCSSRLHLKQNIIHRAISETHKFTFLHPAGMISYAMLHPPASGIVKEVAHASFPIFVNLHGAGLEADSEQVVHSLDGMIESLPVFTVFPTGLTPWSADDWHEVGWSDVEAAIRAIPQWVQAVGWTGPKPDVEKWLLAGHSNGGQGVWYALAHKPDKIIGAAAVSAYSSIQAYVPYQFWRESEAGKMAVIQSKLDTYRHEILVPDNAKDIPIAIQHGAADVNVPVIHSRRMFQLLRNRIGNVRYNELAGEGHWFEGVMTTEMLQRFFNETLQSSAAHDSPHSFVHAVMNPAEAGPRHGVTIDQLVVPGIVGKVRVSFEDGLIILRTQNVQQLTIWRDVYSPSHVENKNNVSNMQGLPRLSILAPSVLQYS